MRKSTTILFLLLAYSLIAAVPGYVNPILPYDYSDPDIIRVGDTYLMTSSSFNSVPGLQILVSKDLVHWSIEDAAIPNRLPGYKEGELFRTACRDIKKEIRCLVISSGHLPSASTTDNCIFSTGIRTAAFTVYAVNCTLGKNLSW